MKNYQKIYLFKQNYKLLKKLIKNLKKKKSQKIMHWSQNCKRDLLKYIKIIDKISTLYIKKAKTSFRLDGAGRKTVHPEINKYINKNKRS